MESCLLVVVRDDLDATDDENTNDVAPPSLRRTDVEVVGVLVALCHGMTFPPLPPVRGLTRNTRSERATHFSQILILQS